MPVIIERIGRDIEASVYKTLGKLGYAPSKKKFFIKPNIVNAHRPDSSCITNPRIVAGIIDYLLDRGAEEIIIGEGAVGTDSRKIFRVTGYEDLCRSKKVRLLNLHGTERTEVGFGNRSFFLPKIIFENEYISVAKLKTHIQTTVSLGLKNQKGLLGCQDRKKSHKDLHNSIASLAGIIQPSLSLIDATNGLQGNGPGRMGKEVRNVNLLICGTDFLLTDFVASRVMGINPDQVKHLRIARERGIGRLDGIIMGEDPGKIKMNFMLPVDHHRIFNLYYWWSDETCSGCSSLLGEVKNEVLKSPALLLRMFFCGFLARRDFIMGDRDKLPDGCGKTLCIGNCAKEFAAKNKLPVICGCPPELKDILVRL